MPEYTDFLRAAQPYVLPEPFAIAHLEEAGSECSPSTWERKPGTFVTELEQPHFPFDPMRFGWPSRFECIEDFPSRRSGLADEPHVAEDANTARLDGRRGKAE